MYKLNPVWFFIGLMVVPPLSLARPEHLVQHHDPIIVDPQLTLPELVDITLENYPEAIMIPALQQEVEALTQRGNSFLAGALSASFYYRDDAVGNDTGNREIEGSIEAPLWNWGQRQAGQNLAQQAVKTNSLKETVLKWQVTGLIRAALWDLALENQRYQLAVKVYEISEKLLATIQRRVDLGDLARADALLAKTELLQKRSALLAAEAELMHARKRFSTLTQITRIPENFREQQTSLTDFTSHPALAAANAMIERKRAKLDWVKAQGSGQSTFALGGKSERGSRFEQDIESMTFSLSVPFGGSSHLAPQIAAVNLELSKAISQRDQLFRNLERVFHEANHILEVDRAELKIADELKAIAKEHLKMARLSFDEGEINLLDFLKIQARTQAAIQQAEEKIIFVDRDIAQFNQAAGVLP
jgi:outer membrane protein TolC